MKKKLIIASFVFYIIIVIIATKALLDRNDNGVFVTKESYYICDAKIKEYDGSSLVHFEKNVDLEKMIDKEVYFFDKNHELHNGKLAAYDKENKTFTVNDVGYEEEKYLGVPDKAYQIIGSLLNIITSRAFYLIFVIIPIIGLFIYEIYLFIKYLSQDKEGKVTNNDRKAKKKNKSV